MALVKGIRVFLGLDQNIMHLLLARAHAIHDGLDGNKILFPSPPVSCPTLLGQIGDLEVAHYAVSAGAHGAAAVRDEKRVIVVTSLESEFVYVKGLAKMASPEHARTLALAAGMFVGEEPKRVKAILAADNIAPLGTVVLHANARILLADFGSRRVTFHWEYTLDGSKTFVSAGATPGATTTVTGLPPGAQVGFRVCVTAAKMPAGSWTPVVTIGIA
jgi:hypothetical protein